jgi:hypothetical protein
MRYPCFKPLLSKRNLYRYIKVDISDKRVFLMNPGPKTGPVQCHIIRKAGKGFIPGTSYPEYFLYLDGPGAKPGNPTSDAKFLLSARKRWGGER